ncbi:hypothetical protein Cni_G27035 [Canna indica]|uniref:protein-serine/threonine phosphatase n=1 Tax=Canna indica TaxID=4628 RepID=A0AAQ3L775_9LILI|nr:hypothetical protein Cni_G27035 [Canna indica]
MMSSIYGRNGVRCLIETGEQHYDTAFSEFTEKWGTESTFSPSSPSLAGGCEIIVIIYSSSPFDLVCFVLFSFLKLFGEGSVEERGTFDLWMDPALLDDIIRRLLEVRDRRPGKKVHLKEAEIRQLCVASKEIFLRQPNLLEIDGPIKICGEF